LLGPVGETATDFICFPHESSARPANQFRVEASRQRPWIGNQGSRSDPSNGANMHEMNAASSVIFTSFPENPRPSRNRGRPLNPQQRGKGRSRRSQCGCLHAGLIIGMRVPLSASGVFLLREVSKHTAASLLGERNRVNLISGGGLSLHEDRDLVQSFGPRLRSDVGRWVV